MSEWLEDGRFRNLDGLRIPPPGGLRRVLRWKLGRRAAPELPDATDLPPPVHATDPAALVDPNTVQLTWLGHATWLVQMDGVSIVTDPTFGRLGYKTVKRLIPPPVQPEDLPPVDLIAVSHNHYDHCDLPSLRAVRRRSPDATIVVPAGLGDWMRRRLGDPVVEIPWFESHPGPVTVHAVPAQHWSIRGPHDERRSHWCGFVFSGSAQVFFAGDTGFGPHFVAIAEAHDIDHALLPIGAYAPRWFMRDQHMGPQEAVEAARLLGAHLLPMHWGTYRLTDEPLDEPPRLATLSAADAGVPMTLLNPGGRWTPSATHGVWSPP